MFVEMENFFGLFLSSCVKRSFVLKIPQFILDHAIKDGKGASCNIVVTQVTVQANASLVLYISSQNIMCILLL